VIVLQTATIKLRFKNGETVEVSIPDFLRDLLSVAYTTAKREGRIYANSIRDNKCYLCGVNEVHLSVEQKKWVIDNICKNCDLMPYLLQRVTQICSFRYCDVNWYIENVLGLPEEMNEYALEGVLTHNIDNMITEYLAKKKNYEEIAKLFPDKDKMFDKVFETVKLMYDKTLMQLRQERIFDEKLIDKVQTIMFPTVLQDFAYVTTIRLYHSLMYDSDYYKIAEKRWTELKVVGKHEHSKVKLFLLGHIDKLYMLDNKTFVIRDKKTARVLRLSKIGKGNFYDTALQLGGYAYLLEQTYNTKVNIIGEIELSRYFDIIPVFCDKTEFINTCDKLCEFIYYRKAPIGRPRGPLCTEKGCSRFELCKDLFKKEWM
jgi:hypothetical protein